MPSASVTGLRAGDEVFGRGAGTWAEYAVAPAEHLALKPANVTFEQAGGVAMSGLTALHALRDSGGVRPGHKVLVVGAGGGVGSFAVQIARSLGAEVTAVQPVQAGPRPVHRRRARRHYTTEDFTQSGETSVRHVVLDVLRHSLTELLRAVERTGTLVPNGGQFYKRWFASTGVILFQGPLLSLVAPQRIRLCHEAPGQADLLVLKELMESGKVAPVVGRTYPLDRVGEAVTYFGEGHAEGKVVITV